MSRRKLFVFIILALAFLLSLFYFWRKEESKVTNYPGAGRNIVAFGDSLVSGIGSDSGGFVSILSGELKVPIINLGVSGETTKSALNRINKLSQYDPKVVILLLGGNDFLLRVPRDTILQNLGELIQKIHATGAIVLLVDLRDDVYKPLAEQYHTAYVGNILDGIFGNPTLMSDGIHPNNAGYQFIAERIEPVLRKVID